MEEERRERAVKLGLPYLEKGPEPAPPSRVSN